MKHHALFSSKDKSEKNTVSSAAILLGALRLKLIRNQPLDHDAMTDIYQTVSIADVVRVHKQSLVKPAIKGRVK